MSFLCRRKKTKYYKNVTTEKSITNTYRLYVSSANVMGTTLTIYYYYFDGILYSHNTNSLAQAESVDNLVTDTTAAITSVDDTTLVLTFSDGSTAFYTRDTAGDLTQTQTQVVTETIEGTADDYDFVKEVTTTYIPKRSKLGIIDRSIKFESSAPGTYSIDLQAGEYEIEIVGAGGGGSKGYEGAIGASGGSGAAFIGIFALEAGTYEVVVGAGGSAGADSNINGSAGTSSSISGVVTAGAGGGGVRVTSGGSGGVLTLNAMPITYSLSTNGNSGATRSTATTASVYGGYGYGGRGGYTNYASGVAGGSGYVKITHVEHNGIVQKSFIVRRK